MANLNSTSSAFAAVECNIKVKDNFMMALLTMVTQVVASAVMGLSSLAKRAAFFLFFRDVLLAYLVTPWWVATSALVGAIIRSASSFVASLAVMWAFPALESCFSPGSIVAFSSSSFARFLALASLRLRFRVAVFGTLSFRMAFCLAGLSCRFPRSCALCH